MEKGGSRASGGRGMVVVGAGLFGAMMSLFLAEEYTARWWLRLLAAIAGAHVGVLAAFAYYRLRKRG